MYEKRKKKKKRTRKEEQKEKRMERKKEHKEPNKRREEEYSTTIAPLQKPSVTTPEQFVAYWKERTEKNSKKWKFPQSNENCVFFHKKAFFFAKNFSLHKIPPKSVFFRNSRGKNAFCEQKRSFGGNFHLLFQQIKKCIMLLELKKKTKNPKNRIPARIAWPTTAVLFSLPFSVFLLSHFSPFLFSSFFSFCFFFFNLENDLFLFFYLIWLLVNEQKGKGETMKKREKNNIFLSEIYLNCCLRRDVLYFASSFFFLCFLFRF